MRTFCFRKSMGCGAVLLLIALVPLAPAAAQPVLFDFDNAPLMSPLPIDLTSGGITAHFAATGPGYSIQYANTMGFTPPGFAGLCIYPSSINLADLLIGFDQSLTVFSILYACQELGCDDAATMRVTAYMNGSYVGTNTRTATFPGTWPTDTLACTFPAGFDSVVVHYDSPPPTCQDYGVIFMADNMWVTASGSSAIADAATIINASIAPNPVTASSTISFALPHPGNVRVAVHDLAGRPVKELWNGPLGAGEQRIELDVNALALRAGVYVLDITAQSVTRSFRLMVVH